MNNEQKKAKELAKLLTAFADKKELLYKNSNDNWERFNGKTVGDVCKLADRLRIKPETKRIALTHQDLIDRELSGKTMRVKYGTMRPIITNFKLSSLYLADEEFTYEELADFEWLDNSPCYKEVECE